MWYELSGFADEMSPQLSEQMDYFDTIGIKHIEARGVDGKNISELSTDEAKEIKKRLFSRGFRFSALGSPIGKIKITDAFDDELSLFRHCIELAKIFECDGIRLFSFYVPQGEAEKYRDEVLSRMQQYVNAAKGSGVKLLHENEKGIYGDTDVRCVDILESLGAENLSATFDPANFVQCGVDTKKAIEILLPYVKYMHIKDAMTDGEVVPAGSGDGNVEYILSKLKNNGYKGFLSLEPHLANFWGFAALEESEAKLKTGHNKEKFTLAYESLKKIIDKID